MKVLLKILKSFMIISVLSLLVIILPDLYITVYSSVHIYNDIERVPYNKCGLLLGTSKYRPEGGVNPYFKQRLDAAAQLYKAGKVDFIIASGDNSEVYYNEPKVMIASLVERGVPSGKIFPEFRSTRNL